MIIDKLERMANQIAANFAYLSDSEQAALKVADHLQRFWDPTMRSEIIEHRNAGSTGLTEIAELAVAKITS